MKIRPNFPEYEGDYLCVIFGLICLMITVSVVVTQLRIAIAGDGCTQAETVIEKNSGAL